MIECHLIIDWSVFVKALDLQLTGNLVGQTREHLRVISTQFQRLVRPIQGKKGEKKRHDHSIQYCQQLYKALDPPDYKHWLENAII